MHLQSVLDLCTLQSWDVSQVAMHAQFSMLAVWDGVSCYSFYLSTATSFHLVHSGNNRQWKFLRLFCLLANFHYYPFTFPHQDLFFMPLSKGDCIQLTGEKV